jgi:iron complex outermembrane recepter protein
LSSQQLLPAGQNDLVPTATARRLSQVNPNDEQGSQLQPDFVYRGFEASPVFGIPQGIAVYLSRGGCPVALRPSGVTGNISGNLVG